MNEEKVIETETKAVNKLVSGFKYEITNQETYNQGGEWLKLIKAKAKELDTLRKSMTAPIDLAKKRIMELFSDPMDRLATAESCLKRGILSYQQESERKRMEEETRLQEMARKEEERKRRVWEERAAKAEAAGKDEKAEELRQQKEDVFILPPIIPSQVEKVAGIQTRAIWKFEIKDANLIPREYMIPNEKMLGEVTRATKGTLQIPGIRIYSEETIAAGR